MLNRRQFATSSIRGLLAFAAISASGLTGCNAITDLENWIPVALTAVSAIVKLLGPIVPAPVAAAIVLIQAGFSAILTAIQNYKAGSGILSDIQNAITAVEAAFASFFQSLSVPSGLLNTIEGLAGIILSTIAAFANQIGPSPAPLPTARVSGNTVSYAPQKRSVSQFKSDWDKMCVQSGHPEARI
jgi:hypothetical protein